MAIRGHKLRIGLSARLIALVAMAAAVSPVCAQTPEPPTTIIVLDGSGSMWGRLDGEKVAKFYNARDALKSSLGKIKPETRVGLASFGHRRQADCADIQVIVPPEGKAGGDKLTAALDKHNPKGKSPLANAMREAAKALPKAAGPKSLIVIHDDLDNCNQDPCAALADIQAAAPGVVIHSIGIGIKGDDAQRLQCLVKPTGGKLVDGQSSEAITAAIDDVLKFASLEKAAPTPAAAVRPAAPTPAPQAAVAPAPKAAAPNARTALRKDGPSALRLATLLAPGQLPTPRAIEWTIRRDDGAVIFTGTGQDVSVPLPQGAYLVDVRDGLLRIADTKATVGAQGETGVDVAINGGLIRTSATTSALAQTTVTLLEAAADGSAGKAAITTSAADLVAGVAVPAGRWVIRLSDGAARADRPVEVKAGASIDVGATPPFGRLQVTVAGDAAGASAPAAVIVYEDDPDAPRGRREIARSAAANPEMVLPAGTYAIVVRQGAVEARDRIVVTAGETVKRTIALSAARLTLTSRLAGSNAAPSDEPVAYRIERIDVVPPVVFSANRQTAELDVPAGRYRIEARHGLINARNSREMTVAAGQALAVTLEQQAGTLKLVGPPNAIGDLLWEILDETGHPLWSTAQASPRATLQAGRYTVRLDHRDKRLERRVEVRPGDVRTIEVRE